MADLLMALYAVVSLVIWLVLEMTGELPRARRDRVEGTIQQTMIILLWPPLLVAIAIILPIIGFSWCLNKIASIVLFGEKR